MSITPDLLLAYYGDDLTGSTDALEFLSRAGIRTVLFIEPPTPQQLSKYTGLQAIGVAGLTRSMPPDEMEATLRPAFEALKALGAPQVHYKVCSTFDSSPAIGSIGRAIDVGAEVFQGPFVPVLVAAPALGRFSFFGNLFARMGIGSQGQVYRLDRHPSMSKHPTTPAHESDLRLHLSEQTDKKIGLLDILQLHQPDTEAAATLQQLIGEGNEVIFFDGVDDNDLQRVGELIDAHASSSKPLFSVGSSGVDMALGGHWRTSGKLSQAPTWPDVQSTDKLLVVSGSCSPVTSRQIEKALHNGFIGIAVDTTALAEGANMDEVLASYIAEAADHISNGQSVLVHTSVGNDDTRVALSHRAFVAQGMTEQQIRSSTAAVFGTALGLLAQGVIERTDLKRLVIAGGDTSSFAARALGIEAVEMIAAVSPGAPLCKAHAPGKPINGLEVNIKGGQVGDENYFLTVLNGK
ncbi:four-carbon acid sugar kinase family protein [Mucilaginibacter daejeonensis]|uniref:four-carbon acid sugar kinase family protein n=1 Tax=Mucilaginibacter daejeonensis TaxID=398049 RepID=UPI001D1771B2|nr:four-carbon acid sugar kinase family protein [Mucilaginibacter daejeonensis]UEG51537.1 four-carbon acid sugar kinase family protein [Mucilaginibacter daejeonensis]